MIYTEDVPRPAARRPLLADEDVLADLIAWQTGGVRSVLVTLVGIEGNAPRPLGAQMVVAEDGRFHGYLSGGCLEPAIVMEAQAALREGRNRLVRYGKGSAYLDLKLPCGSGLDLYFDCSLDANLIAELSARRAAREPFQLAMNLTTGQTSIEAVTGDGVAARDMADGVFYRTCLPPLRVLLAGGGPALVAIASLLAAAGIETQIYSPDDSCRADMAVLGLQVHALTDAGMINAAALDRWTAAVVAFHEHEWEAPVLARILGSPCFYIGVMGSKAAQANRLRELQNLGLAPETLARLRSPVGMIPGAKSRITLAAGILAEIAAEAKATGLLA
jgi:xanthine dehydrogenase accessory factor